MKASIKLLSWQVILPVVLSSFSLQVFAQTPPSLEDAPSSTSEYDGLLAPGSSDYVLADNSEITRVTSNTFEFTMTSDEVVYGSPGDVLIAYGELKNISENPIKIGILRFETDRPEDWETSICTEICYSSEVDSVQQELNPGQTQAFSFYFYSGPVGDTGEAYMVFRDVSSNALGITQNFTGITTFDTSVEEDENQASRVSLIVNPHAESLTLHTTSDYSHSSVSLKLYSVRGDMIKEVDVLRNDEEVSTSDLPSGVYFYMLKGQDSLYASGRLLIQ